MPRTAKRTLRWHKEIYSGSGREKKILPSRKLLEVDLKFLNWIQVQMATAREFSLGIARLGGRKEVSPYPEARIEKESE